MRGWRASALVAPAPLAERQRRVEADVGHAARPPVDAAPALHQLLVHEKAAQRGEVRMAPADDVVDLAFGVAAARLKILDEPAQDRHALLALDGNAGQAPAAIGEALEDLFVVAHCSAFSVGRPALTISRSSHMPLASWPSTSDAIRNTPAVVGVNTKLADWPGPSPVVGSGVVHDGST